MMRAIGTLARSSRKRYNIKASPFPQLAYQNHEKCFSHSSRCLLKTTEMSNDQLNGLRINQTRMMNDLHATCGIGKGERWGPGTTDVGMFRLSLSDADKEVRDWFVETVKKLNCSVSIDAMGNIFAIRKGLRDGPATFIGSHLDTQPTGGRYDGILGVLAGVEALQTLNDNWVETEFPVGVVNWTNEEGARFPKSMSASGVWSGEIPLEDCHNLKEVGQGTATMKSELKRIGYLGQMEASHRAMPIAAHFELHIEQGPILEAAKQHIGVVEGAQGYQWHTITVKGQDCHTGTTDFKNRADAMLTAAKMIVYSHISAAAHGCLASTGIIHAAPGSVNTVPGTVKFSLDVRSPDDSVVAAAIADMKENFLKIAGGETTVLTDVQNRSAKGKPCTVEWKHDFDSKAMRFHDDCIRCVEESAAGLLGPEAGDLMQRMTSGAGHDSVYTSKICPTSMVFVPCRDGISHNPAEYCAPEDCANGANTILGAVLRYDRLRAERGR